MTVRFIEPRRDDPRLAVERRYRMLVGGKSVEARSGRTIKRQSPVHPGLVVGEWPEAAREDVEAAILAARKAFDEGPWPRMTGKERAGYMFKIAALIAEHAEELALIESLEVGMTLAGKRGEMAHAADLWHFAAGQVRSLEGTTHNEFGENALGLVLREPIGVVGIVTPWNYPLIIGSERIPWAIGAGCTVVVKPSEFTSGSTIRLAELAREAGVPDGVINVVTGYGDPAGQLLAEHPGTDMIAFTGSQRVGRIVGAVAAATVKRVGLELGGKGPQVVFADANLEAAADQVSSSIFGNQGQSCIAGSRLIVEKRAHDEMVERLSTIARRITVGDPLSPETNVGALINLTQLEKVEGYVIAGKQAGAEMVVGGNRLGNGGLFYEPTIFTGARPDLSIVRDEIFGPVLSVQTFETAEEAVALANDTIYGLSGMVWSRDISKALKTIRQIRAGRCWVNGTREGFAEMPIGGYRQSGQGRELGRRGFDEYSELKTIWVNLGVAEPWPPARG
ncbi:MAG TPA: aldehyde dehydrogenase family protein [Devosiaceae bacterium]|nr:aldehyde dehydrogenase family protein [Devosiaceae bacterium]